MKLDEFIRHAFPIKDPFKRTQLGFIHNCIKYLAVRFSYIFYKLGVSANMLDVIGLISTIPAFYMIYYSLINQELLFFVIGFSIIAFIIFIDFIDGPLSKMSKYNHTVGNDLDNLCPDIISVMSFIFIGFMTQNELLTIICLVNAIFFFGYKNDTKNSIKDNDAWLLKILHSKFSLLSVRVLPVSIFPLLSLTYIFYQSFAVFLAQIAILSYGILSILWIKATIKDRTKK